MSTDYIIKPRGSGLDLQLISEVEEYLSDYFKSLEKTEEENFQKVLNAFIENKVAPEHFGWVTGYGHDDIGREKVEKVFASVFNTEASIVRPTFVSGTHAISCVLFGILRPGDELVSIAGEPYDTLHEVIGIRSKEAKKQRSRDLNYGSLIDFGITYKEVPLKNDFEVDLDTIPKYVSPKTKMVFIQRSKGYQWRKSITISEIRKIISIVKNISEKIVCFVDNCFGELTENLEPTQVGADVACGSLVKNIGGGIVPAGGYIVGKKELVDLASSRLTAPGIGSKGGCTFDLNRSILQGLFLAPNIVLQALKGISLASYIFEKKEFEVLPSACELKTDIVVAIKLRSEKLVKDICTMVQANSPINSHVLPIPCKLPGYKDEVIMGGGTFIEGSTIELSCDAPIREPYILYFQGGLSYFHTKCVLSKILESGTLTN